MKEKLSTFEWQTFDSWNFFLWFKCLFGHNWLWQSKVWMLAAERLPTIKGIKETITHFLPKTLRLFFFFFSLFLSLSLSLSLSTIGEYKELFEVISLSFWRSRGGFFHLEMWKSRFKFWNFSSPASKLKEKRQLSFFLDLMGRSKKVDEGLGFYNFNFKKCYLKISFWGSLCMLGLWKT